MWEIVCLPNWRISIKTKNYLGVYPWRGRCRLKGSLLPLWILRHGSSRLTWISLFLIKTTQHYKMVFWRQNFKHEMCKLQSEWIVCPSLVMQPWSLVLPKPKKTKKRSRMTRHSMSRPTFIIPGRDFVVVLIYCKSSGNYKNFKFIRTTLYH